MSAALETGAELAAAIRAHAHDQGVSVHSLTRRLSTEPRKWLLQLEMAQRPKPATRARIAALLRGDLPPLPPPNNFQASPGRALSGHSTSDRAASARIRSGHIDLANVQYVYRDPCFKCGVRGDIGCPHQRPLT